MKTSNKMVTKYCFSGVLAALVIAVAEPDAHSQVFVPDGSDSIGEYDAVTGALINGSFITGPFSEFVPGFDVVASGSYVVVSSDENLLEYSSATGALLDSNLNHIPSGGTYADVPGALALSGNSLFVGSQDGGEGVYDFNLTTGVGTQLKQPGKPDVEGYGVAVSGNNLFTVNDGSPSAYISEYTTSGVLEKANFATIPGVGQASLLRISGNDLFALSFLPFLPNGTQADIITEYNATTGALINPSLVSGLPAEGTFFTVSGNSLFVSEETLSTIGASTVVEALDATTGEPLSAPEPSTWALVLCGLGVLAYWRRRHASVVGDVMATPTT